MCVCVCGGGGSPSPLVRLHNSLRLNCLCVYLSHRANTILATKARKLVPNGYIYTPAVPTPIHPFTHSQSTRKQNCQQAQKNKTKRLPTKHYTNISLYIKSIHHHSNRSHTSLHHCRHHHKDASNIIITIHKSKESVSYKKC